MLARRKGPESVYSETDIVQFAAPIWYADEGSGNITLHVMRLGHAEEVHGAKCIEAQT